MSKDNYFGGRCGECYAYGHCLGLIGPDVIKANKTTCDYEPSRWKPTGEIVKLGLKAHRSRGRRFKAWLLGLFKKGELIITDADMSKVARMKAEDFIKYPSGAEVDRAERRRDGVRLYAWASYLPEPNTVEQLALLGRITDIVVKATKRGEK